MQSHCHYACLCLPGEPLAPLPSTSMQFQINLTLCFHLRTWQEDKSTRRSFIPIRISLIYDVPVKLVPLSQ